MKNITVSVPEDVYHRARVHAAQQHTSVSALVADYLRTLDDEDDSFAAAVAERERLVRLVDPRFSAADRLSRDEVHDRDALR